MFLRDLPHEIQYNILEHCSPRDLAVLSRVHTSVRDVAEYALYGHIWYRAQPLDMIVMTIPSWDYEAVPQRLKENKSLLHTLATNSWKASTVKAFYIELENDQGCDRNSNVIRFVLVKLAEVLEKMSNLVDLRIIYNPMKGSEDRISQVIRGGHFKLHTLYLEYSQDLEGIITDQPQLRLFGVHFSLHILDMNLWTKIEQLYQSSSRRRTMPVVFVGCLPYYGPIHMLPSFHRPGEALQACRETAASLNKWCNGFDRNSGYQLSLSLIGISEENISLLGEMIEAMAACRRDYYPNGMYSCLYIVLHDKYIQKPWHFHEFVKPLALFDDVKRLCLFLPDSEKEALRLLSTDLRLCLVTRNLGRRSTWPTIQEIMLQGQIVEENILLDRESEWTEDDEGEMQTGSEDEDYGDAYGGYDVYDSPYDFGVWDEII